MPAKSRHNRRKIPSRRTYTETAANAISGKVDANTSDRPGNFSLPSNSDSKKLNYANVDSSDVANEMKWIGIVTGIVLICLAASYIIFR
jgi:hypothetical protein